MYAAGPSVFTRRPRSTRNGSSTCSAASTASRLAASSRRRLAVKTPSSIAPRELEMRKLASSKNGSAESGGGLCGIAVSVDGGDRTPDAPPGRVGVREPDRHDEVDSE